MEAFGGRLVGDGPESAAEVRPACHAAPDAGSSWATTAVPIRRPDSPVLVLLGLVGGLDSTVQAAVVAAAAGSLGGLDLAEPLRLGIAVAAGAAWMWFARMDEGGPMSERSCGRLDVRHVE